MKYYTSTTAFNCGIDLQSHQMYVCLMDCAGNKLVHTNIQGNDWNYFLEHIAPGRHSLTIVAECTFNWYWLADACQREGLTFVRDHALYLKAIRGGKNKNDRRDSEKLAHLLRSNLIPPSHVYPGTKRPVRALWRQRLDYVWQRAELLARIESHQLAEGKNPVKQSRPNQDPWEKHTRHQPRRNHSLPKTSNCTRMGRYDCIAGSAMVASGVVSPIKDPCKTRNLDCRN